MADERNVAHDNNVVADKAKTAGSIKLFCSP